ncbi:hypothetical protein IQ07DRAFT_601236 [Pyrenochaeta sp. DS3sAY3a]|nr:hypothetical protein IQ07DRAFT_601236 [Pyrenochaeta sp. DS3sAY3a]
MASPDQVDKNRRTVRRMGQPPPDEEFYKSLYLKSNWTQKDFVRGFDISWEKDMQFENWIKERFQLEDQYKTLVFGTRASNWEIANAIKHAMDTANFSWMKKSAIKGIWMKENADRLDVPETSKRKRVAYYGDDEDENFKRREPRRKIPIEDAPMIITYSKAGDVERIAMTVRDTIEEGVTIKMAGGMFNWKAVDCDVLSAYLHEYGVDLEKKHTFHLTDKTEEKEIEDSADLRAAITTLYKAGGTINMHVREIKWYE